jgi:uncharacterized protein
MDGIRPRYVSSLIAEDLNSKMVFLGGPRQVGKTTVARALAENCRNPVYLNWDSRPHRQTIMRRQWVPESDLIILDEIHKYSKWKSLVKGMWDTRRPQERILITGSSRLDIFRRGGDSMQGRYHHYRLHPFSFAEIQNGILARAPYRKDPPELEFSPPSKGVDELLRFGGFPEPFLAGDERTWSRWQKERIDRVFREDIRDVENVRSMAQVELLADLIPHRVGSPASVLSLSADIEASPKTVKSWVELLCRNYYVFRVPPYHRNLARALKKESKLYLWDWSQVPDPGARFENMVGAHLLKMAHFYEDAHGIRTELYYVRDLEKREVDFLVVWDRTPWLLVECKLTRERSLGTMRYMKERLKPKAAYVVTLNDSDDYLDRDTGIRIIPASRFLAALV